MNGFDVRAIGWMATRDAFTDTVRPVLGLPRRTPVGAMRRLGAAWSDVEESIRVDRRTLPSFGMTLIPLQARLSPRAETALRAFAAELVGSCPCAYGEMALRRRCREGAAQFATMFALSATLPVFTSIERTSFSGFPLILLTIGIWKLVTTLQVRRARRAFARMGVYASSSGANVAPRSDPAHETSDKEAMRFSVRRRKSAHAHDDEH